MGSSCVKRHLVELNRKKVVGFVLLISVGGQKAETEIIMSKQKFPQFWR